MARPSIKQSALGFQIIPSVPASQAAGTNLSLLAHWAAWGGGRPIASLYLHIPFCFHKCHYCDFYSIVDDKNRFEIFTDHLIAELRAAAPLLTHPIRTIFIGGGTPTLLPEPLWGRLLVAMGQELDFSQLLEFTVEANPETVTAPLLARLRKGGVNRISLGAQSFRTDHLKTLERWHDPASVGRAVKLAREAGLTNLNLDLIYAIPGQTLDQWRADMEAALALSPDHLACYALTYEPNTAMTRKLQLKQFSPCQEDLEADMFNLAIDHLAGAGFEQYEISNFARINPGNPPQNTVGQTASSETSAVSHRSLHNMAYWMNENWFALGPSASGHLDGLRWKNQPHLGRYLECPTGSPTQDIERLERHQSIGEQLMMRIRLIDGMQNAWLDDMKDDERQAALEKFIAQGLLERTATHTRLTRAGQLLTDRIVGELI